VQLVHVLIRLVHHLRRDELDLLEAVQNVSSRLFGAKVRLVELSHHEVKIGPHSHKLVESAALHKIALLGNVSFVRELHFA
jgi:hypothetical protein